MNYYNSEYAYQRGEKPITYWHKKTILNFLKYYIAEMKKSQEWNKKFIRLLKTTNLSEKEVWEQLNKLKLYNLQQTFLIKTEVHMTGSFVMNKLRHTKFYKVANEKELIARLRWVLKPKMYEQLRIEGIVNDNR